MNTWTFNRLELVGLLVMVASLAVLGTLGVVSDVVEEDVSCYDKYGNVIQDTTCVTETFEYEVEATFAVFLVCLGTILFLIGFLKGL